RARRFVLRRIPVYGGLYIGIVAVFLAAETRLVFPASTVAEAWLKPFDDRMQDVTLTSADGTKLHAWWLPPARPDAGAFLISHGNGGNLSFRGDMGYDLNRLTGAGVMLYDYPGYGKSEGAPTEAGCYAAGDAAYAWLTGEGKTPAGRVVLLGESLGGGVAVDLASRHGHRALVLMCTFTSLPAAAKSRFPFLPTHTFMRSRFDSLSKIGRCTRPVFAAHGTADSTVPFWQGEALFAAANEPKEFLRLEGFHHNLVGNDLYDQLAAFLNRHPPQE
ncbi:MAG TPA: alpha/beta hydrolase, partial [Urbifossiella sp.]|nr:alpha/beta hydrolase [Urbifossiella sp.]